MPKINNKNAATNFLVAAEYFTPFRKGVPDA